MKIGDYIRQLRLSLKLRQEDIYKSTNIDQSKLSRIEKYDQAASFDEICRICNALTITPNELWESVKNEYIVKEGDVSRQVSDSTREEGRETGTGTEKSHT